MKIWFLFLVFICTVAYSKSTNAYLLTPPVAGSLCYTSNHDFDEYRYDQQIAHCARAVTTAKKIEICRRDGVADRTNYTVDHIIPLSIGGSNEDDNLWCQNKILNVTRQEFSAYVKLRNGEITQLEAIIFILKLKFNFNTLDK